MPVLSTTIMSVLSTIRAWSKPPYFKRTVRLFSLERIHRDRELLHLIMVASDGRNELCCPFCEKGMEFPWSWSFKKTKDAVVVKCSKCCIKLRVHSIGYVERL